MMNADSDCQNTFISEVPKSTQLSILDETAQQKSMTLRDNLLQIAVRDSIIIYDLTGSGENDVETKKRKKPQEIFFFNATKQFIAPERYVETGIKIVEAHEDFTRDGTRSGFMVTEVESNRNGEMCFIKQQNRIYKRKKNQLK